MKRLLTFVLVAVATLACASPALASKRQVSIFQDDRILLESGPDARAKALGELDRVGVDVVKVLVNWRLIAPGGESKPAGFNGADPASYNQDAWAPYDDVVRGAQARGMRVLFAVGGLAPDWASGKSRVAGAKKPDLGEFHKFVRAVGTRYSGSYGAGSSAPAPTPPPDPILPIPPVKASAAQTALPRVTLWSVWNEPNLANWLAPQRRSDGTPVAPHYYRRMIYGAKSALSQTGHGRDAFLIGELLPYGSSRIRIRPLEFIREMACVDRHYRPFRGKAARKRGCRHFRPLPGAGFAFHPYTLAGGPNVRTSHPDEVTIAYMSRLVKTLRRLGRTNRLKRHGMPVWVTEFGFQTNPPDPFQSPIRKVPRFMGLSEWLTYRNPKVVSYSWYLLRDDKATGSGFARYRGFQSGLRFANGKAKPGVYKAYRLPFFPRLRGGRKVEAWGGVRAAGKGRRVTVQVRRGGKWRKLGVATTAARGYIRKTFRISHPAKRKFRLRYGKRTSAELRAVRR